MTELDPRGMLSLTEQFPNQCREAHAIAKEAKLPRLENRPGLVALTGLGGSAAGGDFVRALFEAHGASPFFVNRDYHIPNFVGLGDLVFVCSYSGNTEETLSAYAEAKKAGAKIIAVTSGGKLKELADADGHEVIQVPGGQPPRTAMGYMLIPVIVACERLHLIPAQDYEAAFNLLERCSGEWSVDGGDAQPKEVATALVDKTVLVYGLGIAAGLVANRWARQLNENAKAHAFPNGFPELNHNEILGWVNAPRQSGNGYVVVCLSLGNEAAKMRTRIEATKKLIGDSARFLDVEAKGESLLERLLSLAYFGDFVSLYLARLYNTDPEKMEYIDQLKIELAKVE